MVATDGHRLALIDRKVDGELPKKGVIMPRKGLVEVRKLLGQGGRRCGAGPDPPRGQRRQDHLRRGRVLHAPRRGGVPGLPAGDPEAGQDRRCRSHVTIPGCARARLGARQRARTGREADAPDGQARAPASNPDAGEASEEIEVSYSGAELSIGFNARYLIDVLGVRRGRTDRARAHRRGRPGVLRGRGRR